MSDEIIAMINVLYQIDTRLRVHSYYLKETIYFHDDKKCPRCISHYYLGINNQEVY